MIDPASTSARRTPWAAIAPTAENALAERQPFGQGDAQRKRHSDALGVVGHVRADTGHAVAGMQTRDPSADLLDDPGARVAVRDEIVEASANSRQCGGHPIVADLLEHLLYRIGPLERLADPAL